MGGTFTDEDRRRVEEDVVHAADRIIEGKGATSFGVGAVIAWAVDAMLRDRRSILTVSATTPEYGCALSLPRLVSGSGIIRTLGVKTVAEGIETRSVARTCRTLGFDFGQGFLLGRPS